MRLYQKLLLSLTIILPFSFALSPVENIDLNIIKLLIPFIFLVWLANSLLYKKIIFDHRFRFWLLLAFLFLTIVSLFWTTAQANAFRKTLFFLSTIPLYFIFYQAQYKNSNFTHKFIKLLILGATLLATLSLIQFLSQFIFGLDFTLNIFRTYISPIFLGHALSELVNQYSSWLVNISGHTILRTFGTFPDPHLFSLYLTMILPLIFYLFVTSKNKKYIFASLLIILTILFSFSRASYLALIIGGLFLIFTSQPVKLIKKNWLFFYLLTTIFIFLIIIPNPLSFRLSSSFNLQEGSNSGRIKMWQIAVQTINTHPLGGLGLGSFAEQIDSSVNFRNPIYAHNLFLDFGAETGIFNMSILFFLVLSPILSYFIFRNRQPIPKNNNLLLYKYLATSFIIFFVHSLFETPFFSIRVFPLFLLLLAINPSLFKKNTQY